MYQLYQVTNSYLCAGFIDTGTLEKMEVKKENCAPILWPKISYWIIQAIKIDYILI